MMPHAITTLHLFAWFPPQHDVGTEGRFLGQSKIVVCAGEWVQKEKGTRKVKILLKKEMFTVILL